MRHTPFQTVKPVLAEKRLAFKNHQRNAPMTGGALIFLIALNDLFILIYVLSE